MNRDLATYLFGLKDEISIRIWLYAVSKMARNGTANIMINDLLLQFHITKTELDKYFKPHHAQKLQVVKILAQTERFISLNFRLRTKQEAGPQQLKLIAKADNEALIKIDEAEKAEQSMLPAKKEKEPPVKGMLEYIPKENYSPTHALTQKLIADYIVFFKMMQVDKASFIGQTLDFEFAIPPKPNGLDAKILRELAVYFSTIPGINSESRIVYLFNKIYLNWWNFSDFIKKGGYEPRMIKYNINRILPELQNLKKNESAETDKREAELNNKVRKARSKDYSRLVKKRDQGD